MSQISRVMQSDNISAEGKASTMTLGNMKASHGLAFAKSFKVELPT